MTEPTITCPKCKTEIPLTESLAAPLVESVKKNYEQQLKEKEAGYSKRERELKDREQAVEKSKASLEEQVAEKLKQERGKIEADAAKKARLLLENDIDKKSKENAELQDALKKQNEKLAEAQKAETDFRKKQRELDDARREMDLTIEKKVAQQAADIREKSKKEAEESLKLKFAEKDLVIQGMQQKIEELKRKAEQGSQQLQGEAQELDLEESLRTKFPMDSIEPVPKGEHGGDALHRVRGPLGQICGTILWETKRTKNWSDSWLAKLREDQRTAKADLAVIVSHALPKEVETFDQIDGVWVVHTKCVLPVALAIRQTLIEVAGAQKASEGQQTKMELVYKYLTGQRFRQRVEAIVEAFSSMRRDLDSEKKAIMKQWAKRDTQIEQVIGATVGMYGDLQGIAGKTLQEIEGLEMKALEAPPYRERDKN